MRLLIFLVEILFLKTIIIIKQLTLNNKDKTMTKFLSIFSLLFLFAFSADSCPYQSMAKIDSQLFSSENQIDTDTFKKISTLRTQGELALQNGDIENLKKFLIKHWLCLNNLTKIKG